ncbi:MAG TPA: hypothetical protein VMM83_07515 [Longimicrobiales bacterium]|nr:hypothetical protein [Longimicrobiales bacterium]
MRFSNSRHGAAIMRKRYHLIMPLMAGLALGGCDFLDPTGVDNPTVTEETFLGTPNAAASWTRGVERQLAATINQVVMGAEVASDNVFNNRTLFSKVFDIPQIDASDFDVTNIQAEIHQLREMADRGLTVVVPADESATDEIRARLHLYRGFGYLLAGELFVGLPGEPDGPVLTPAQHLALAVEDFQAAAGLTSDPAREMAAVLAVARAQYAAGNSPAAEAAAQQVIDVAPDVILWAEYDAVDGPGNTMQFAVYDSPFGDEFQPLPRLDFLFPKYYSEVAGDQSPIAVVKGEEAYLILAEAALSRSEVGNARDDLLDLLDLVASRPTALIDDRGQSRGRDGGTWIYPNAADILVAASPDADPKAGLVLTRSGDPVEIPIVSGTSVTEAMLNAAISEEEMLYLLYLMRQEIFVLEGRRMTDLGIRFPVALDEALTNPQVDEGSAALQAQIPAFIPLDLGLDRFDYDDGDLLAVIHNDMNEVLVANRTSDAVLPFH